jgi:hypothetical protein
VSLAVLASASPVEAEAATATAAGVWAEALKAAKAQREHNKRARDMIV